MRKSGKPVLHHENSADPLVRETRQSGVLCHVTSLATPFGVGDLGPSAMQFVDFLASAGQRLWQVLPLGPPAHNDSPYSCYSAMAGNRVLISPEQLLVDGLVTQDHVDQCRGSDERQDSVDFEQVHQRKEEILRVAFMTFREQNSSEAQSKFGQFKQDQESWLIDFARYEAIMNHLDELDWTRWPDGLPQRDQESLQRWDDQLRQEIEFSCFVQFLFHQQWLQLRQYASKAGVSLCGDMPIFVAHESSDVWANQSFFSLDKRGKPSLVAGVPPDYFSKTGQLWGNPQYNWETIEASDFQWWTDRFAKSLEQFDLLRVDHFRGFEAYWEIPAGEKTAVNGRWVQGPGEKPFRAAQAKLGPLPLIAEDLGLITEAVYELRDALDFPGMRVLQFGFDNPDDHFHRPADYPVNSVAYTGTHDNDTTMGWHKQHQKDAAFLQLAQPYLSSDDGPVHWQWINAVLQSDAFLTIFPIQDLLGLDNQARMNVPGKAKGNWAWQMQQGVLESAIADQMQSLTVASRR